MKDLEEETGQTVWKHSAGDPEREGRLKDKNSAPQHPGEGVQRQGKQITLEIASSTLWGNGTGNRGTRLHRLGLVSPCGRRKSWWHLKWQEQRSTSHCAVCWGDSTPKIGIQY